ncbi:RNA polymerase II holoenzyme cyclin-like subunit [Recurvomyces mirabilis]|uniref:RNA polymerase II holoenzyme cyclin-like subunit n=1 Tax=Recurvomyces mirabilis TaxID=574656 RepID=A0AAE0WIA3_9PEZI|nr:RNA polymerase II holoenzyme cyclin-like subunit [Recurvomyces mirabilis]KAK5160383.1 RNA polymerase II holoenzyme cyclin-like subunit [Recurvomyces mirabilis]
MASNYWDSTQAKHWTFTKPELTEIRRNLTASNPGLATKHPLPDPRHINIYLQTHLQKLARRLNLRQQSVATAQIYLKRFYLRIEIRKTNPYLIMATALYLACKMEESPQHIRLVLGEAARLWPELHANETGKIGECEFAMISTLQSRLIVHHPYRILTEFGGLFGLSSEEMVLAGSVVNDCFVTDLPLLYPPHVMAIAAIFLAVVLRPAGQPAGLQAHSSSGPSSPAGVAALSAGAAQSAMAGIAGLKQAGPKLGKLVDWLAESRVEMESVVDAVQEFVSLYQCWEEYQERVVKEAVGRLTREGK